MTNGYSVLSRKDSTIPLKNEDPLYYFQNYVNSKALHLYYEWKKYNNGYKVIMFKFLNLRIEKRNGVSIEKKVIMSCP